VSFGKICSSNTNDLDSEFVLGGSDTSVIVDVLFEVVVWVHVNFLPVNNLIVDSMDNFVKKDTVIEISKEIINVDTFDVE